MMKSLAQTIGAKRGYYDVVLTTSLSSTDDQDLLQLIQSMPGLSASEKVRNYIRSSMQYFPHCAGGAVGDGAVGDPNG